MTTAVITGCGVASAFGLGTRALFAGVAEGRAAVAPIRGFDARTFPTRVAAAVPGPWDDGRLRDRKVAFALIAAAEAWAHAGCGDAERGAALSIAIGLEQA